ncbi:MAG: ABC transporter permease [Acidobacteria bacterium]|nr:ABC transporter permease [Acidobacteriota bacterium]MBI3423520.1 ABC transporter permease [Acidobacteriota bacterium]
MESLWKDVRFAVRSLLKRPGFTLLVLLTLALGIGANTAIFSVVNAVLLAPLPYRQPEQLVVLAAKNDKKGVTQQPVSYPNVKDWKEQNQVFAQLAGVRGESFSLTDRAEPERVAGLRVSVNILSLLGVQPVLGRDFSPEEEQPGRERVALIAYNLWQQRYAGNPQLVGQTLSLDGKAYTVIGILPRGLKQPGLTLPSVPPSGADVWIPLIPATSEQNRNFANIRVVARLKPDATFAQAQTEMNALAARLERQYPGINTDLGVEVTRLHDHLTGRVRRALWVLLGAVGCVLLIACANVANLLLARAPERQAEMALRAALGATRWRLLRQLLCECLALSVTGGLLGLMLAAFGVPLLTGLSASSIPRVEEIGISWPVLGFTLLMALLTGVIFGLAPALQTSGIQLVAALKEGKKGSLGGVRARRWLNGLVVAELALALVLLTGAGLMLRSFRAVNAVEPGFDPHNLLTLAVPLPTGSYKEQAQQLQFYERALPALKQLPGVLAAAGVFRLPVTGFATSIFTVQGQPVAPGQEPQADYRTVSFDYFRAIKMPLVRGRDFTERDNAQAADAVIINEELARRFFPNEDPVGKRLQVGEEKTRWREIVGVVANAKLAGLEAKTDPAIYLPFPQNTWPNALRNSFLIVRTAGDPNQSHAAIRAALRAIDPALPLAQWRTLEEILAESLAARRFNTALLSVFALIAGVLAAVGIYGTMSYLVTARTPELGLRMALGAQGRDVLRLIVGQGVWLVALGVTSGLLASLALTRLLGNLLFGVSGTDGLTFTAMAVLLAAVALLACYLPARRATKVDPLVALRCE